MLIGVNSETLYLKEERRRLASRGPCREAAVQAPCKARGAASQPPNPLALVASCVLAGGNTQQASMKKNKGARGRGLRCLPLWTPKARRFTIDLTNIRRLLDEECRNLIILNSNGVFGLRNDIVHHLLTPHFFVWFVELNELINHHLIPHS
jgi:hypothetical protein